MATLEEEWQKILNEPEELRRCRERLQHDLFAMLFVLAGNMMKSFNIERLETLEWQLRWLRVEAAKLKELMIEHYDNDKENNTE